METQIKQLTFKGQRIYVGLDVHLKSWSVTVLSQTSVLKKFSQNPNPDDLYSFLTKTYPEAEYHSVYEAGFCGFWAHYRLIELGVHNIVVNPSDVPTTVGEKVRKTDVIDSGKLARSLRAGELKGIYVPNNTAVEIRSLIRLRDLVTKDQTRVKNRIKAHLRYLGIEIPAQFAGPRIWTFAFVKWMRELELKTPYGKQTLDFLVSQYEDLRAQRLSMVRAMRELSRVERFSEPLRLLMTIPGVGQLTALSLMAEIDDIKRFKSADKLASYIGLVPMCYSSGEHDGVGDLTVRRNNRLRCAIVEAAWVAVRSDPAMTLAFSSYCQRMIANKAIIKIARKLVNRIFYVMKHQKEYVPCVVS